MKIAVMMAAYNAAPYVSDAIGSVLRQRPAAQFDILVVDDGSTDETAAHVQAMGAPEVRLVRQANRGVTATRNILLSMLAPDTDFVTVLDADDLSPNGRFARTLGYFEADPGLDLVFAESLLFGSTGADPMEPDFDTPTLRVRGVQMGAGLYRYDLVRRTGRYDERFRQAEDLDFMIRMLEFGPKYLVTDDIAYYYRRHAGNMTHDAGTLQRDVARAMLMAAKRKRQAGVAAFPRGFFDLKDYPEHPEWY